MSRLEDTPGLFGETTGGGTIGKVTCQWCNTVYNADNETESGEIIDHSIDSTGFAFFGDLQICDCCFEKVEQAVIENMDVILAWLGRLLAKHRKQLEREEALMRDTVLRRPIKSAAESFRNRFFGQTISDPDTIQALREMIETIRCSIIPPKEEF